MLGNIVLLLFMLAWFALTFEDFISYLTKRVVSRMKEDETTATTGETT